MLLRYFAGYLKRAQTYGNRMHVTTLSHRVFTTAMGNSYNQRPYMSECIDYVLLP